MTQSAVLDFGPTDLEARDTLDANATDEPWFMTDGQNVVPDPETAPFDATDAQTQPQNADQQDLRASPAALGENEIIAATGQVATETVESAGILPSPLVEKSIEASTAAVVGTGEPAGQGNAGQVAATPAAFPIATARPRNPKISKCHEAIWNLEQQIKDQEKAVSDQCVVVSRLEAEVKIERKDLKEATKDLIELQGKLAEAQADLGEAYDADEREWRMLYGDPAAPKPQGVIIADKSPSLADAIANPIALASPAATAPTPTATRTIIDPNPAITTDLWVLKSKEWAGGATNAQIEKLNGEDVRTIANLEEYMRNGNLVPGRVKGIGQTAVDKISDALMAWRKKNPMPVPREVPCEATDAAAEVAKECPEAESPAVAAAVESPGATEPQVADTLPLADLDEPAAGEPDLEAAFTAAYTAGCEACIADKPTAANPHEQGTQLWLSWDQGWQDTNAG